MELFLGIVTGAIFGFLLQKARVLRFEKQVGFLLLADMTIIKFMFSAIATGLVLVYAMNDMGLVVLSPKSTVLGAQIIGGLIFGLGWAILGYCPGTSVGALAEGRVHAFWGILGMLGGAALYAEAYPALRTSVLTWGDFGKTTLPELPGVNHWIVIVAALALIFGLFYQFEKRGL